MHEHTAVLPLVSTEGELPDFGYDTITALRSGAANGVKYEIEGYIRMCLTHFPNLKVYYTGGDQLSFSDDVAPYITFDSQLVLRGLNTLLSRA
jgi:type III pantothenate kinase